MILNKEVNFYDNIEGYKKAYKMKTSTPTRRWKVIVKDGLKIDISLYSWKKLGANHKILSGMSLDALKELYGRESKVTTKIYATQIQEVYRKEILEKSPDINDFL